MLRNYIKIAFRSLVRNKVYSFINIGGLALGIAAFLLILEYISLEKSVNQFHANLPNTYRLLNQDIKGQTWPQVEPGWAAIAKERFPEVADFCRFEDGVGQGIVKSEAAKDMSFREQNVGYAEGNFFSFFSFPLKSGQAATFNKPDVAFVSESYAKKYFGQQNPIGKLLTLFNQFGKKTYTVEGVFADMSEASSIKYDMVFSLETLKNKANLGENSWANLDNTSSQYINTYFSLNKNVDYKALEIKLTTVRNELKADKDGVIFKLQPLSEIHLAASFSDTYQHTGNIKYVYMLGGIAFLILLIAWFNYINLSTANALKRANEVGVRKVIGATQGNLISQFLGESLLINLLAFALGMVLVALLQPIFNQLIGKNLTLNVLTTSPLWLVGLGLLLVGSLASGAYTAFSLSNFQPIETLKGKLGKSVGGVLLRKSLVVSQFSISIVLLLVTALIYNQLNYMKNKNLGVSLSQLLVIQGPEIGKDSTYKNRKTAFLNDIAQQSFVKDYCTSGSVPGKFYNFATSGFTQPNSKPGDELKQYSFAIIADRYLKTYDIPLKAGRNFTAQETDVEWNDNSKVLLNEKAIEQLGFKTAEEAIKTKIKWDERYLEIVGVVKDYHHTSLQRAIDPIIFYPQNNSGYFTIRLTGDQLSDKVATLERLYKNNFSGNPFEYFFADDNFNKSYLSEQQYGYLFTTASAWAIVIACLGLFGLATFTVEQRTKEIGIRKVLGASVSSVVVLLSSDFVKLVMISIVIACPVAYYVMDKWLADFAYRVAIEWWIFAGAAILTVTVAVLTVGFQAIKAALMNPVESLKTE
jgi:putative ABC transport system permease protein